VYSKTSRKSRRWTSIPSTAKPAVGASPTARRAANVNVTAIIRDGDISRSSPVRDVRVLGLDPGSLVTGYAVIDWISGKACYIVSGCIRTKGESLPERLAEIFAAVSKIATQWQPHEVAVESVFMHRSAGSALKLGQARGAAICGTFAVGAPVFEYAPRAIKQAVVGTGAAQKEQVQMMVSQVLRLSAQVKAELRADAADALAVALCHAHSRQLNHLLGVAR
jgi:crossover junction endodeoxyribonuclease RuvC